MPQSTLVSQPRLVVAMPTTAGRHVSIFWAIHLRKMPLPVGTHVLARTDYSVAVNRNALVRWALAVPDLTHILWWDDDIWPPLDAVPTLFGYGEPIVSGVYRDKQRRSVLANFRETPEGLRIDRVEPPGPGQHVRVDMTGLGFCLMDLRLFRRLDPPWFEYAEDLGEDAYFFRRVNQALGLRPLASGDVACRHEQPALIATDGTVEPVAVAHPVGRRE